MLETIPALLAQRRDDAADRRAVVTPDEAVTYAELDATSSTLAARMVGVGVGVGDRVALLAPNGIEWAVHAMAVTRIGAVLVPLSTLLRPPELVAQLRTASVTHLVAATEFRNRCYLDELAAEVAGIGAITDAHRLPELPALRGVWGLGDVPADEADRAVVSALEADVHPATDLVVLFTSGSRGRPKGVIHTHGGALRATHAGLDIRDIRAGSVLYVPMPFFWTGGFSTGLLSALLAGATLLTESEPDAARTLAFLERERVTIFRGWPDQASALAAHPDFASTDLSSLGDTSLAAVLPEERRPAPGTRSNIFGMTESFGPYAADPLDIDLPAGKYGSCGRPFAGVEIRIVDPDSGRSCGPDEQGEIHLRGPNLLRGICGRERDEVFTPDGWFRTGDLGRYDADGYLWYSGRLDDMVKVKGATVYPSEVEAALRAIPAVGPAFVTDIDVGGRPAIAALVVTAEAPDAVLAGVRARLSAFKVPTRWLFCDDAGAVPLLASGKVDKLALQALLAEHGAVLQSEKL